jgi:hypothetical protein
MISRIRLVLPLLLLAALPFAAHADEPGRHPLYVHALSDLRTARWLLSHRADSRAEAHDEDAAVFEIDKAFDEITRAAITDGKDIHAPVGIDVPPERAGRLRRALEILRQVRADVARAEEDPYTRGLRNRALVHVDEAINATQRAMADKRYFH